MPVERSTGRVFGCSGVCARVTTPIDNIRPAKRTREANRTVCLPPKRNRDFQKTQCFKSGKRLKQREFPICFSFTHGFSRVTQGKQRLSFNRFNGFLAVDNRKPLKRF